MKSDLYLCIGDEAQRIFKARKPAVNVKMERFPRVLDEMQNVFKRERNVTHERVLFNRRKQRENEEFEKFYAKLSALAGRCDFANAAENVCDIFILNMLESDCQRKLSRSTKLPVDFYRIALSYEQGECAYKSYTGKPEDIPKDQAVGAAEITVGVTIVTRRTLRAKLDLIASCPAKGVTCIACRKLGHFERIFRGIRRGTNQWRRRGGVGLVRDENKDRQSMHSVDNVAEDQVAWVNQQGSGENESIDVRIRLLNGDGNQEKERDGTEGSWGSTPG